MVESELMSRARAGDGAAFRVLTEPHRRELHVHCYRMLGSLQDAEDAYQDTMLSAWRGLASFGERASLRTWLYRIATNRCLSTLRTARRRPAKAWDIPGVDPPDPTSLGEVVWLEPYPDDPGDGRFDQLLGPEARYEQAESISLAFVTALQVLPPRQLAVLVLRDVLGFRAGEVAEMLDTTVESVKGALKRARAGMLAHRSVTDDREPPPPPRSPAEGTLVTTFVQAYESADIGALVTMLTDDIFLSMPPMPLEFRGRDVVARFFDGIFAAGRRFELIPTRANGQPAFGAYLRPPTGAGQGVGLYVLTAAGDRIRAMARFEAGVLPWFGLPASVPG